MAFRNRVDAGRQAGIAVDAGDLVGVWAIVHGVNEIFAAFAVRQVGRQAERCAAHY